MKRKHKNLVMLSLIAGSIFFTSCREERKDEPAEPVQNEMRQEDEINHEGHDDEMQVYKGEATTAKFHDENTGKTYQLYIDVKDALVNSDVEEAQRKAEDLTEVLEERQKGEDLSAAANKIAETGDVNKQREAFSELTVAMEDVLEEGISSGAIYKQFCPMAFEGKGDYWFSNSEDIFNPYYGDRMLKCGRVEATIQ